MQTDNVLTQLTFFHSLFKSKKHNKIGDKKEMLNF